MNPTDNPTPDLSVVIPAYNEESRLGRTLKRLAEYFAAVSYTTEIVIVDDGSTDGTVALAASHAQSFASFRIVRHEVNRGKGAAVRTGMLDARGAVRLFYDADGSTPIGEVGPALAHHRNGAAVVIGSRSMPGSNRATRQPAHRHLAGAVFRYMVYLVAIPGFRDTQCGFKSFTAEAAEAIFPRQILERFSFDVELLFIARRLGYRVVEMPVTWRDTADSRLSFLKDGWRMFTDLVMIRLYQLRGRYRKLPEK